MKMVDPEIRRWILVLIALFISEILGAVFLTEYKF